MVGEAFNVARKFFPGKKSSMLKKIREDGASADFKIIMVNDDAVESDYKPRLMRGEYYVFVDVVRGTAKMVP